MIARLLEEWVGNSYQQPGFRWELVDEGRVVPVLHRKVGSEVPSDRYGSEKVSKPPYCLASLRRRRAEDDYRFAEKETLPD